MFSQQFHQHLLPLFRHLNIPAPPLNPANQYTLHLADDSKIHLEDIEQRWLTISAQLPLPKPCSAAFLLELLQANLNVEEETSLIFSVAQSRDEIVVWGKLAVAQISGDTLSSLIDRMAWTLGLLRQWIAKENRQRTQRNAPQPTHLQGAASRLQARPTIR